MSPGKAVKYASRSRFTPFVCYKLGLNESKEFLKPIANHYLAIYHSVKVNYQTEATASEKEIVAIEEPRN